MVYDELDRLVSGTDPNGKTATLQYDAAGRTIKRIDARGLVTRYFYDKASRLTRVEHWDAAETVMADQVTYSYDALGNRTQMVDPTGTTAYAYDALNRLTSVTFPGSQTVSYQYSNAGNRSKVTHPGGTKYADYAYDAANALSTATDWLGKQTGYAYNNAGALATTILPSATGIATTNTYDSADRLTGITHSQAVDPNAMLVASFDFASSATWTPPSGMTEAFDVISRASVQSGGASIESAYAVQAAAGPTGAKTATASQSADDGNAHILALRPAPGQSISFRAAASAGATGGVTSLVINKPTGTAQNDVMIASLAVRTQTVSITPPSGWALVSRSDNAGGVSLAVYRKVAGGSEPSSYTWTFTTANDVAGGIQSFSGVDTADPIIAQSGQTTPSSLNHATPSITVPPASGPAVASVAYTLNAVGNRTQMVDATGTTTYAYDNLHRLTSVTYPGPQTDTYTYDANGNRLTKNATSYAYDNADQMTVAGGVSYTYDNNGNVTARGSDTFAWDHENRLVSATIGGVTTTYAYNGDGLRTSRSSGGTTTTYVWDVAAGLPVLLQETTGANTSTYVYGLGRISVTDQGGAQTYFLADGLGSTIKLVDGSGASTGDYTYDVFGAVKTHTGSSTEFGFTSEQNDPNGLEYLRARYYDNATGRFLSRDPLGGGYPYAGGNPANMLDPTGLYEICAPDLSACFDSTDVGLPADPPIAGVDGYCLYTAGEVFFCDGAEGISQVGVWDCSSETCDEVLISFLFACCGPNDDDLRNGGGGAVPGVGSVTGRPYIKAGCAQCSVRWANAPRITFKSSHAAKHQARLLANGVAPAQAEAAIRNRIIEVTSGPNVLQTGNFWGMIEVNGVWLQYRVFTLPNGTLNVGTYFIP